MSSIRGLMSYSLTSGCLEVLLQVILLFLVERVFLLELNVWVIPPEGGLNVGSK